MKCHKHVLTSEICFGNNFGFYMKYIKNQTNVSGQIKDYNICICCFTAKQAALRRKSKDRLAQNQDKCLSVATCLTYYCCYSDRD